MARASRIRRGLALPLLAALLLAAALPGRALAATVVVINNDGAGEGFNDPTPRAPIGGNTGTTIGAQRLIAFQRAADIWGGLVASAVPITVGATFDALACNASGAILGSAGPTTAIRDFAGAPRPGTWYAIALANALHGSALNPGGTDITAQFNSALGTTCAFPGGWYYGLDGAPPAGQIDFVTVLLHELGHGLGFLSFVDLATGAKAMGFDDAYMRYLERHGANPSDFPSMSDAQRLAASVDTGNLHWVGPRVVAASGVLTAGAPASHVRMYAPSTPQLGSSVSHWDTVLSPNQLMEPSYTQAIHEPGLEIPLFQDLGWTVAQRTEPGLDVSPKSMNYATVQAGSAKDAIFTVRNVGTATLHVSATRIVNLGPGTGPGEFSVGAGVDAFDLGPGEAQAVTVRFAPAAPAGTKSALLRLTSDDGAGPNRDVLLSGVAGLPKHDLAVVNVTAPEEVAAAPGKPVTRPVQVQIQNRGDHDEPLPGAAVLGDGVTTGLVRLAVRLVDDDAEKCQPAIVALNGARNAALFPGGTAVLKRKALLTVEYLVTYNCAAPASSRGRDRSPGDYSYTATVHHEILGAPDGHPKDNVCPHPPLGADPSSGGTIKDTGCGPQKSRRDAGAGAILTNVTPTGGKPPRK